MVYRVIGIIGSNSSEGLNILFTELTETGGKWSYEIITGQQKDYGNNWNGQLENAANISVPEYQLLDAAFGRYIGESVNQFIRENNLEHRVHIIASQGHSVILQGKSTTLQLGHGAYIAAETRLPVVSDLLSLDIAFGGQAAPLPAIAEKLLSPFETGTVFPPALIIALMGVLRWREEANMISSQTGARQDSIGGALWLGTDA